MAEDRTKGRVYGFTDHGIAVWETLRPNNSSELPRATTAWSETVMLRALSRRALSSCETSLRLGSPPRRGVCPRSGADTRVLYAGG